MTTGSTKCDYPFRLIERPLKNGKGWVVRVLCGCHNHDIVETLFGHPYVVRLKNNEKTMIIDITKSMVKPKNILLTLKEHNEKTLQPLNKCILSELHIGDLKEAPDINVTFNEFVRA